LHVSYGVPGFSHLFPVGLCQIRVRNVSGSVSTGSWLIVRDRVTHPRRRNGGFRLALGEADADPIATCEGYGADPRTLPDSINDREEGLA
jgi:hypothetical protein